METYIVVVKSHCYFSGKDTMSFYGAFNTYEKAAERKHELELEGYNAYIYKGNDNHWTLYERRYTY